jgi:hypothetical protein
MFSSPNRFLSFPAEHCEIQLLTSACLEVRVEQLGSVWNDFYGILNLKFVVKFGEKFQALLKSNKN